MKLNLKLNLILLIGLITYISLWANYPFSFNASDPWGYSIRAFDISQGTFFDNPDDFVFSHRLGITLPTSFFYAIWGVNQFSTHAITLISALVIIITIWFASPTPGSKIYALVLSLTSVSLFKYSVDLYPDIIVTAWVALSSLLLFNRHKFIDSKLWLVPVIATCLLFFAFLAKMSAYWVLPLWIMALLSDWKQKNIKAFTHFYAPAIIVGIILLISYLYFCYLYWGDPLIRFHNIQSMTKTHLWSFESGNTQQLIDRLSIKPVILFYNTFGLLLVLTLLSLFKLPTQLKPWLYYLLFTIFFFWFGTTSFSDYQPIVPIERVILVCLPGFIILSAYFLSQLRIPVINSYQLLHQTIKIIILIIACLPFIIYISSWGIMHDASAESMSIVKQEANAYPDKQSLLITSDLRSKDSLKYFFGYKYPKNIHVISAEQLPELINKGLNYKKILIYIDNQLSMFLYRAYGNDFYDELIYKMEFNLIYKRNQVFLYDVIKEEKLIKLNNVIKEKYPNKHYIGIVNSTKNN